MKTPNPKTSEFYFKFLTFPKNSHQSAKTAYENFENFTVFSVTPVFELQQ